MDSAVTALNGKPELEETAQLEEEDEHHNVKQLRFDGNEILASKQELQETISKKPENMEWVGPSYFYMLWVHVLELNTIIILYTRSCHDRVYLAVMLFKLLL